MLKHAVIASIAIATAGCASLPEGDPKMDAALKQFEPRPEVASVYIYCDAWMGTVFTNVAIDGEPLGQLSTYTYLHTELPPGKHSVSVLANNADTVEFEAQEGALHYIWQEKKSGWPLPAIKLHLMSEAAGQMGVGRTDYRVPSHRAEGQSGLKAAAVAGISAAVVFPLVLLYAAPGLGAAAVMAGAH